MLRWFFTSTCPNCRKPVDKKAKFCRHCGWGNKDTWRNCTQCGASVAADSQHCWSCGVDMTTQPGDQIISDRWRREPGVFAVRVTIETPQERLRHGVQVDDGVTGVLMRNGVVEETLKPGYNEMTTFLQRLFGGGKPSGTLEALVAANEPVEVLVDTTPGSLSSADFSPLEGAVLLQVQLTDLAAFQRKWMPFGTDLFRDDDLAQPIHSRVGEVLRRLVSGQSVEMLARQSDLRRELEAELGRELPRLLESSGLKFAGVVDVRLTGEALETHRSQQSDLGATTRDQQWAKKKRELEQSGELARITDETEFNEKVAELSHQFMLTQMERDHLVEMRKIGFGNQQAVETTRGEIAVERVKRDWEDEKDERDLAQLRRVQEQQLKAKAELERLKAEAQKREIDNKAAENENAVKLAQGLKGADPTVVAAVVPDDKARILVEMQKALNPTPQIVMQQPDQPGAAFAPRRAGSLAAVVEQLVGGVGVVVLEMPGKKFRACGTAWIVAGKGILATNAHVAEAVVKAHEEAGLSAAVLFPGGGVAIKGIQLHPAYGQNSGTEVLPSHDVAVMEVNGTLPHPGLPLASKAKAMALKQTQPAAYLGYPSEKLAGGGVNLERPKAMAKPGHLTAFRDWQLRDGPPSDTFLIEHDIGATGGASGSPMIDEDGEVIGLLCACNMQISTNAETQKLERSPHAAMVNFAQRIDVLTDWAGW